MQRKLKSVFRSSSKKKRDSLTNGERSTPASSTRGGPSFEEQQRSSVERSMHGSQQGTRSRPISSAYDDRRTSNVSRQQSQATEFANNETVLTPDKTMVHDHKAYLPALSSVENSRDDSYMSLGGDRRLITGESDLEHEEDVADRNIARYSISSADAAKRKPLPIPGTEIEPSMARRSSVVASSVSGTGSNVVPSATSKYSLGNGTTTKGGLVDSVPPRKDQTAHEEDRWKDGDWPIRSAQTEPSLGWSMRRPRQSISDDESSSASSRHDPRQLTAMEHSAGDAVKVVKMNGPDEVEKVTEQLLDGVVNLRNTVDEDKEVRYAPAVTHEVVKPHEHEIITHKIFREIHNYTYNHRIQPIYDLQVLPPRHWIRQGDGLLEVSADKIAMWTGDNRRWEMREKHFLMPDGIQHPAYTFRTEPEIIHHPTTISDEGFERKETTILYPPTLDDLTGYDGLVQPVHFDHKTGKRWLGEITTLDKMQAQAEDFENNGSLNMRELEGNLPIVPGVNDVPDLSPSGTEKERGKRELSAKDSVFV